MNHVSTSVATSVARSVVVLGLVFFGLMGLLSPIMAGAPGMRGNTLATSFSPNQQPGAIHADSTQETPDTSTTPSSDPPPLPLSQALEIGIAENFQMQIARNNLSIARNNQTLGNAGFLPVLEGTTTLTERVEDSEFSAGGNDRTTEGARSSSRNATLQARWLIFDGLRMFYERDLLGEQQEIADLQMRQQLESLVAAIIVSYYDLIRIGRQAENLKNSVEISEERIEIEKTKVDLGSGSRADLLQAQSDLNADRAAYLREQNRFNQAKIAFNTLLARKYDAAFSVTDIIPIDSTLIEAELRAEWEQNNKALRLARRTLTSTRLERKKIAAERLPEISLQSAYSFNRSENDGGFISFNETTGFSAGLTARIPIFDGFQVARRIQNADIAVQNSELELDAVRLQLDANFASLIRTYQNQLELVRLEEENLTNAKESLEIAVERFRLGTISSLEFREAQQTLLDAENRWIIARYDAKVAETELLLLSGLLI